MDFIIFSSIHYLDFNLSQEFKMHGEKLNLKNRSINSNCFDKTEMLKPFNDISQSVDMLVRLLGGDILDDPIQNLEITPKQLNVRLIFILETFQFHFDDVFI